MALRLLDLSLSIPDDVRHLGVEVVLAVVRLEVEVHHVAVEIDDLFSKLGVRGVERVARRQRLDVVEDAAVQVRIADGGGPRRALLRLGAVDDREEGVDDRAAQVVDGPYLVWRGVDRDGRETHRTGTDEQLHGAW